MFIPITHLHTCHYNRYKAIIYKVALSYSRPEIVLVADSQVVIYIIYNQLVICYAYLSDPFIFIFFALSLFM